jgi:hypothetical protein
MIDETINSSNIFINILHENMLECNNVEEDIIFMQDLAASHRAVKNRYGKIT